MRPTPSPSVSSRIQSFAVPARVPVESVAIERVHAAVRETGTEWNEVENDLRNLSKAIPLYEANAGWPEVPSEATIADQRRPLKETTTLEECDHQVSRYYYYLLVAILSHILYWNCNSAVYAGSIDKMYRQIRTWKRDYSKEHTHFSAII